MTKLQGLLKDREYLVLNRDTGTFEKAPVTPEFLRAIIMINRKVMYSTAFSFVFLLLVAVIFIGLLSVQRLSALSNNSNANYSNFTFENQTYNFSYVESNLSEWEIGLMNKTVTNKTFALFVFPQPSIYPFWMKDTYYPLDMVWINGSTVTYIANATPCSWYSPQQLNCTLYNNYSQGHIADYVMAGSISKLAEKL